MAFLERLDSKRTAQGPRQPEVSGAPPTPRRPADKVNPPAAAAGPIGRPPLPPPSFPAGAGRDLPTSGTARPAATTPSSRPAREPAARPAAPTQAPELPGFDQLQHVSDHVMSPNELLDVPEGVRVVTPYGEQGRDGSLNLNPEGEMKYKEAIVSRRKQFGPHPFAGDPNAPPAPARLGGRMFNAFSGQWVE